MTEPRDTPLPLSAETLALAMRAVMDVTTRERALPYIPKIVAQFATLDAARAAVPAEGERPAKVTNVDYGHSDEGGIVRATITTYGAAHPVPDADTRE